jgi:hypothetical protein
MSPLKKASFSEPNHEKELDTREAEPYSLVGYCNAVYRGMRGDST